MNMRHMAFMNINFIEESFELLEPVALTADGLDDPDGMAGMLPALNYNKPKSATSLRQICLTPHYHY